MCGDEAPHIGVGDNIDGEVGPFLAEERAHHTREKAREFGMDVVFTSESGIYKAVIGSREDLGVTSVQPLIV